MVRLIVYKHQRKALNACHEELEREIEEIREKRIDKKSVLGQIEKKTFSFYLDALNQKKIISLQ